MSKQIFINLPVSDLKRSMEFYTAIGFVNNPQFTDETSACMAWSENIFVMILTFPRFESFITKPRANTSETVAVINSILVGSNEEVHAFMEKALAAGGTEPTEPKDYGFMIQRSFQDPDGNEWEVFFMDMSKLTLGSE
jgi:predicted lactoylglutathione lyase